MTNLDNYVKGFGFNVADLTKEELKAVQNELIRINRGETILDGVLADKPVYTASGTAGLKNE